MFDPDWEIVKRLADMKDDNCPKCGGEIIIDGPSLDCTYVSCINCTWTWGYYFDSTRLSELIREKLNLISLQKKGNPNVLYTQMV